ncbi:MAG TPA: SDR family NAD(P)-dependent oxidoreductase [Alphaproteobacteria bacterium]|nr:SDR family NAD(P)-dependent oxidoreductase [Alphaproteobacteria bacterium]
MARFACALITGATSGIGTAFARALDSGTDLLLTGRDGAKLAELARELVRPGRRVDSLAADLATETGRAVAIEAALARPVDLLVNNAGLGRLGPLETNPAATELEMAQVNVVAVVALTRALLPGMIARAEADGRRAGVIVVASTAAFQPTPFLTTYGATKSFDLHFAEGLASELRGRPVDVLALCPGATATAFFARAGIPGDTLRRIAAPERVAREALAALGRKRVHVVGGINRLGAFLVRLAPRDVAADGAARLLRARLPR